MPWQIDPDHKTCPASKPFAVVTKEEDGKPGKLVACHESEKAAKRQLAALYAKETTDRATEAWLGSDAAAREAVLEALELSTIERLLERDMTALGIRDTHLSRKKLAAIYARDKGICGICKKPVKLGDGRRSEGPTLDHHPKKLADGGTDDEDNLRLAHHRCNNSEH